ncbi:MAG: geranylgeranyl reductase family protein [Bacteroidetes bacterium]|nr:MAG: geranylgeranyl reductase family protein [Bacteroidota bacterium]
MIKTKVCIVGAGPAGAATALRLSYLGIPSVLVDKAVFPRDKVCGDAISGKVTTLLNRLDPAILKRFCAIPAAGADIWGIRFVAPNYKSLDVPFYTTYDRRFESAPGYVSKRMDFDHFLIQEVKRRPDIDLHEGVSIQRYEKTESGFRVFDKSGQFAVEAHLLIVADGAHSAFARHYAGLDKDPKHHAAAVRAYYKNIEGLHPDNFLELHYIQDIQPGYFWIFPLPNGYANVGVGMRSDYIGKYKVKLKSMLTDIIQTHPLFKERFKNATLESKIQGFPLPLGSKKRRLSGDHFMLVGDAGHLVDPFSGEGIGNGMYSGFIAAELAEKCFEQNDFSANFMRAYDERVARVLGKEMQLSYALQRLLRYPWLSNKVANFVVNNEHLIHTISKMYTDFHLRKQLLNPLFWVRLMLKKKGVPQKKAGQT